MTPARSGPRRGFTILEIVLTLSMAVVLMSLVGATLQFYSQNMNVRDMDVRRVQLAAAVLQMVSDDLRAAVQSEPFDSSTLEAFLASAAGGTIAQSLDPAASDVLGLDGFGLDGLEGAPLEETAVLPDSMDLQTSTMTLQQPGLIGNQFQLQFDISRLPRLEQWQQRLGETAGEVADVPSDLKTVTYYVQPAGAVGGVPDPMQSYLPQEALAADGAVAGGLVRRELDRAANKWALDTGAMAGLMVTGDLVAPEVVGLAFSYFDGVLWQPFWNSDEMQTLPMAIQIKLTLGDHTAGPTGDGAAAAPRVFTQIVALPAGRPAPIDSAPMGGF
jgi:type II secretory pathway pseudopilin PulG